MAAQTKSNTSLYDPRFARDLSWEQSTQTGFPTKNRDVCLYMAFFLLFTDEYMHSTTINNDIIFIIKVLQLMFDQARRCRSECEIIVTEDQKAPWLLPPVKILLYNLNIFEEGFHMI